MDLSQLLDYRHAFEFAPMGLVLSRERTILDCNRALLDMFGATRADFVGQSFAKLYPTHAEFERTGVRIEMNLGAQGMYADDRIMKRFAGPRRDELFWCHVSGRAIEVDSPHAAGIWAFEDLSQRRALKVDLTPREREVAALLIDGLTSKLIGKRFGVSPRTVDIYRARLLRKTGAATTPDLIHRLLS